MNSAGTTPLDNFPTLYSNGHDVLRYSDGERRIVINDSWKPFFSDEYHGDHRHVIRIALPSKYHSCNIQGKNEFECDCWSCVPLVSAHINDATGASVCFYCELARVAPDVKYTEIFNMYLDVSAQRNPGNQMAYAATRQKFYEQRAFACDLKPAKR